MRPLHTHFPNLVWLAGALAFAAVTFHGVYG